MINPRNTEIQKKRMDLELSSYLAYCLALFFIIAVIGTTILAQQLTTTSTKYYNLLIFVVALFTIFVLILFLFTSSWVQSRLFGPISKLIDLSTHSDALTQLALFKTNSTDIEILRILFTKLVIHRIENEKLEKQAAIATIAAQVAHDIRSPLAALAVLENDLDILSEDKRILIRSAINRIRDISNHLLEKNRQTNRSDKISNQIEQMSPQLIFALLEQMITEKRIQYRSKLNIEIHDQFDSESYGSFALIQLIEFKRIISNLINNAVEAMPNGGHVSLKLSRNNENIQIVINDDGNGIEENILKRLMLQSGETHGKKNGTGLGLYHAKKTLEACKGEIDITSAIGKGTTVTLTIPKAATPNWFLEKITLKPAMTVAIVDDDSSIHQIWQARMNSFFHTAQIELLHFSTPNELQIYLQAQSDNNSNKLYLIDYEFLDQDNTGLDLIENERIASCSILVTSRYEEPELRQRSEKLKVKLIPKSIAGFVPIELNNKKLFDAILLDDDSLIRLLWKQIANKENKKFLAFATTEDFYDNLNSIDFNTPIYIDSDLKSTVRGQDVADVLQSKGYHNLYLTTGYDPNHFGRISNVKATVGKKPPWMNMDILG